MISETEVRELALNQKLRIMEIILWDDLCRHSEKAELLEWHRKELEEMITLVEEMITQRLIFAKALEDRGVMLRFRSLRFCRC